MISESNYRLGQHSIYKGLPYKDADKYYERQPARRAGNLSAVRLIEKYIKDIKTICEVGAGSCAFSISLYNENNNLKITAVDKCIEAVEYGKEIAKDMGIPIDYQYKDLFNFNGKFDLVLSLGVIEHYDEDMRNLFINKNIELSNKYILIAIPNQESINFKNYVNWGAGHGVKYEEDHQKFTNKDLVKSLCNAGLNVLLSDGFQVFLSEKDFLMEDFGNNVQFINLMKNHLEKYDMNLAKKYPDIDFRKADINNMSLAELDLTNEERQKYGFMNFVLAEIKK